jgi:azurin
MSRNSIAVLAAGLAAAAVLATVAPAAAAPREIKITATDQMQYSVKKIDAKPGEELKIVLTVVSSMPKTEMSHNWILLAKGANPDGFVMAAAMARATDYLPAAKQDQVLAHTKLAGGGETVEVTFKAPAEAGNYNYLCSFPGHYAGGMKGVLAVK